MMVAMSSEAARVEWDDLPKRVYLDTSTLQVLNDFGRWIYDGDDLELTDRQRQIPALVEELEALRQMFRANLRMPFQVVVTEPALAEVAGRADRRFSRWAYEVMDHWLFHSADEPVPIAGPWLEQPAFGMISAKDRVLLQDALNNRCDAFMTMERRLPTAGAFFRRRTGLQILRPTACLALVRPWSALFS